MSDALLPFVLIVGLLAFSWWTITSIWKQSKQTEEDEQPKEMRAKDYLTIALVVIAVLMLFPRAPELIAPLLE